METETINRGLLLFISETAEYWMETDFIVAAEIFRDYYCGRSHARMKLYWLIFAIAVF